MCPLAVGFRQVRYRLGSGYSLGGWLPGNTLVVKWPGDDEGGVLVEMAPDVDELLSSH